MAQTKQALVYRALTNLGVLPQGQNPGSEEYNSVEALVDPMVEDLIARDVVFVEDADAIEDKYFLALAHVLTGHAQSIFGMQSDPALTARAQKGELDLGDMNRNTVKYTHMRPMRSDYPVPSVADISTLFTT